jgi:hypothetical protein
MTILTSVVGRATVKRKVAGLNLNSDDFPVCALFIGIFSHGYCGNPGRNLGEEVKLGFAEPHFDADNSSICALPVLAVVGFVGTREGIPGKEYIRGGIPGKESNWGGIPAGKRSHEFKKKSSSPSPSPKKSKKLFSLSQIFQTAKNDAANGR